MFSRSIVLAIVIVQTFSELVKLNPEFNWQLDKDCDKSTSTWKFDAGSWVICNTDSKENCTLKSGLIDIHPANRLLINISTSTNVEESKKKASFLMKKDGVIDTRKNIPLVYNISRKEFFNHVDSLKFDGMNKARRIQLFFTSQGYCGSITNVNIYYFRCSGTSQQLARFEETPAPDGKKMKKKISGECVDNAKLMGTNKPIMECFYDGTSKVQGNCICDRGYSPSDTYCEECNAGEFKPKEGNEPCIRCGKHTRHNQLQTCCNCEFNFYRAFNEKKNCSADCYEPPSKPRNIIITNKTSHDATLSWQAPARLGSASFEKYRLWCTNCPNDKRIDVYTTELSLHLTDLGAFAVYNMSIISQNRITYLTGKRNPGIISFKTERGVPGIIRNVIQEVKSDGTVKFTWNPPFDQGSENMVYIITYGDITLTQEDRSFEIHPGNQDKLYIVKISAKVDYQGRIYHGLAYKVTVKVKGGIPLKLATGVALGIFIFIIASLITAFCIWKKRNPAYLQVVRMEDGSVKLPARFYTGGSLYVDPKSYSDVDDAINDFAYEIDRSDLSVGEKVGDGEFADVFRGTLRREGRKIDVAIKTLKPDATKADRDDFLSEAVILGQFNDQNVIKLEGVVYQDEPNAIILEYMVNGSLDKFLQKNELQFTVYELLEMAKGVASGMKCLSEMGFVHRDLAARNILVNSERECKIADFGMSLEIKIDESTETKCGKVPVRWTAPEAIQFKKFTTASDVWSYGVVLWEIMSYGERPYWDWSNLDVLEKVTSGYRLPPPMGCPRLVHDFMLHCWNKDRVKRPLFSTIRSKILSWLRDPSLLEDIAHSIKLDPNLDYTVMQTVSKWLETIGMGRYAPNFIEQGFATPRQLLLLTMSEIEALGVGSKEHQKQIYKAIENTRMQVESQFKNSDGAVKMNFNAL